MYDQTVNEKNQNFIIDCLFLFIFGTLGSSARILSFGSSKFLYEILTFLFLSCLLFDRLLWILFYKLCICRLISFYIIFFCFYASISLFYNNFLAYILLFVVAFLIYYWAFSLLIIIVPAISWPFKIALMAYFCKKLCIFLWYILYLSSPFS
jgi:hypothetical protein